MNIIKLSAINSTNDYLKQMITNSSPENFTVVVADIQTGGRGQMGTSWLAEPHKNLTFSVLIKDGLHKTDDIFTLNVAVTISIIQVLQNYNIPGISIKWPNDILAGNKKIGGILIENSFKSDSTIQSIIGIGLNINQSNFDDIVTAGSLYTITGRTFNKDEIFIEVLHTIKNNIALLEDNQDLLWKQYDAYLFKKSIPMPFEKENQRFMGIIKGVCRDGRLIVMLEDDSLQYFGIKEIKMLY